MSCVLCVHYRSRETESMEYLKNVIYHFMCSDSTGREQLVTPLSTLLHFTQAEVSVEHPNTHVPVATCCHYWWVIQVTVHGKYHLRFQNRLVIIQHTHTHNADDDDDRTCYSSYLPLLLCYAKCRTVSDTHIHVQILYNS